MLSLDPIEITFQDYIKNSIDPGIRYTIFKLLDSNQVGMRASVGLSSQKVFETEVMKELHYWMANKENIKLVNFMTINTKEVLFALADELERVAGRIRAGA